MSSSQPQLQPQPPSPPTHNESRRSHAKVGRGVKCGFKSKAASKNSVCKAEDGSDTTTKAAAAPRGELKPQEPSATCTGAQPTKNRRTANDQDACCEGKGDRARSHSGKGPEAQPKDEDVTSGGGPEPTAAVPSDGARRANKLEVRSGALPTPLSSFICTWLVQSSFHFLRRC